MDADEFATYSQLSDAWNVGDNAGTGGSYLVLYSTGASISTIATGLQNVTLIKPDADGWPWGSVDGNVQSNEVSFKNENGLGAIDDNYTYILSLIHI